jgi:hypothetical protein
MAFTISMRQPHCFDATGLRLMRMLLAIACWLGACATAGSCAPGDIVVPKHIAPPECSDLHTIPVYLLMLSYSLQAERTCGRSGRSFERATGRMACTGLRKVRLGRECECADGNGKRVGEGTRVLRLSSSRYMQGRHAQPVVVAGDISLPLRHSSQTKHAVMEGEERRSLDEMRSASSAHR